MADDGVYILKTVGPQYRVIYKIAFYEIYWDDINCTYTEDPDVMIRNARDMFQNSKVFKSKEDALLYAGNIADEHSSLEYGIQTININRTF
jgi:hypothetical protein